MGRIAGLLGLSGIALLSASVCMEWYLLIDQFESSLNEELKKLQSDLDQLKVEYGVMKKDLAVTVYRKEIILGIDI